MSSVSQPRTIATGNFGTFWHAGGLRKVSVSGASDRVSAGYRSRGSPDAGIVDCPLSRARIRGPCRIVRILQEIRPRAQGGTAGERSRSRPAALGHGAGGCCPADIPARPPDPPQAWRPSAWRRPRAQPVWRPGRKVRRPLRCRNRAMRLPGSDWPQSIHAPQASRVSALGCRSAASRATPIDRDPGSGRSPRRRADPDRRPDGSCSRIQPHSGACALGGYPRRSSGSGRFPVSVEIHGMIQNRNMISIALRSRHATTPP